MKAVSESEGKYIYIYIKIEKASHLLENDFIYQQPPLPLPFSSCASPHAA